MLEARVVVEAQRRKVVRVAQFCLLDTRETVLHELVFNQQMAVLLDPVGVHRQKTDALPRDLGSVRHLDRFSSRGTAARLLESRRRRLT